MLSEFIDPYVIKARYAPALLTLFPLIIFLSLVLNKLNFGNTTILFISILEGLVFPLFISEICRNYGTKLERKNYDKWGGKPTTILLRMSDDSFDDVTKSRLYDYIGSQFSIDLKSDNSDRNISNAINRIKSIFHKKNDSLLDKHNVEYGYVRNLAGCNKILFVESFILLVITTVYIIYNKSYQSAFYESISVICFFLLSLALSIILGRWVYPEMVKDRAFRYARTLIESYYREVNDSIK